MFGECNLGRVSKIARESRVPGRERWEKYPPPPPFPTQCTLTRAPLGSSDTFLRLRSPLQTKMAAVR